MKNMFRKISDSCRHLDIYQLLAIPIIFLILLFAVDFKSKDVVIGIIIPSSGENALRAINHRNGLMLAAKHINQLGGINGKKLRMEMRDSKGSPESAAAITRDLIYETGVSAIIGGITPGETRVIQFLAEKAQTPFLTALCTHFEITASDADYTFRSISDDQKQFDAIAEFSSKRFNSRKPALIYDNDLYGTESAQKYIETCAKYGQQICAALSYKPGSLNFRKQLEIIQSSNPDALIILAPPADSAIILRQAREARFTHPVLGGNAMSTPQFLSLAGVYSEGTVITLPFNARLGGQRADYFLSEYFEQHSVQADADAAMGYEALMILALALKAGEPDRNAIRNAVAALHGWESVSGSGGFDARGNQVRPAEIAIIKERQKIPANLGELF